LRRTANSERRVKKIQRVYESLTKKHLVRVGKDLRKVGGGVVMVVRAWGRESKSVDKAAQQISNAAL
jgi:hypothetical protein